MYCLCEQDNLRFVSWPSVSEGHYVLHPDPITSDNVGEAMESGALFARKFDLEVRYNSLRCVVMRHDSL